MIARFLFFLTALFVLVSTRDAHAADPPPRTRRIAVVVGANQAAPGRQALRYAHSDAQLMAEVLVRVGRFAKNDVQVLLEPRPAEIQAALDRAAREAQAAGSESLLLFYYSGHADGQQVFPHGEPLALTDLRDRVARSGARVRVAILDTCRGGSWTRAKGLSVGPPLDPIDLMSVATEGSALLSSSSGLENAHEAEAVKGSFFTHHVTAGLLGAADKSGDGNVTLQEVFEYARERTVRDSARLATTPQHPSFDVQLRGRQDVVLAQLASSPSALELSQSSALEVIHLASGVTVLETPPGKQQLRLALLPGRYLVRRVVDGRVFSKELEIRSGTTMALADGQLEASGNERLALKDAAAESRPYAAHSTPPKNWWELRMALGASTGPRQTFGARLYDPRRGDEGNLERSLAGAFSLTYAITDRLAWSVPVPAFAYRLGDDGEFEAIPRAGLTSFGYSSIEGLIGNVEGGISSRTWVAPPFSLVTDAAVDWDFVTASRGPFRGRLLGMRAGGGFLWDLGDKVTLHFGLGWAGTLRLGEMQPALVNGITVEPPSPSSAIVIGSFQTLGFRPQPLVSVHLSRRFSLDGYASWAFDLQGGNVRDRYLGGFTWAF